MVKSFFSWRLWLKGLIWVAVYTVAAYMLSVENTWPVFTLCVVCGITDDMLDRLWPSEGPG